MKLVLVGLLIGSLAISPGVLAQNTVDLPRSGTISGPVNDAEPMPVDPEGMDAFEPLQRKAFEKYGPLGLVTLGMDRSEIVVMCHTIAQGYAAYAGEETDRERRVGKFAEVWRFEQRLQAPLQQAHGALGESNYDRAVTTSNEAMGLLSMMGDPQLKLDLQSGELQTEEDLMFGWVTGLAARCGQMLDAMGIAQVSGDPPAEYIESMTGFRYRGADYAEIFANTELAPYAKAMCRDGGAPDFSGAPLGKRGYEGMSLLDWAMECNDHASFDALIAARFDLDAKGLYEDPPLITTASEKRLWFLTRLLDEGVNPDTMGRTETALRTANTDLNAINSGGDTLAAFNLLRERRASLNSSIFQRSMWYKWGLHDSRWDLILMHWDEFESDPVELAGLLEFYFSGDMNWAKKEHEGAARQVKAFLIKDYGVCFPVGKIFEMKMNERGFRIQPDCSKGDLSQVLRLLSTTFQTLAPPDLAHKRRRGQPENVG